MLLCFWRLLGLQSLQSLFVVIPLLPLCYNWVSEIFKNRHDNNILNIKLLVHVLALHYVEMCSNSILLLLFEFFNNHYLLLVFNQGCFSLQVSYLQGRTWSRARGMPFYGAKKNEVLLGTQYIIRCAVPCSMLNETLQRLYMLGHVPAFTIQVSTLLQHLLYMVGHVPAFTIQVRTLLQHFT